MNHSGKKKKKTKEKTAVLIVLLAAAICVICGAAFLLIRENKKPAAEKTEKKAETKQTETAAEPSAKPAEITSILTGLPVSEEERDTRPMAIMIENTKACQPQYGTTKASVLYEAPVEGGITRMIGIFEDYKDLPRLGNVRSCRPYFVQIAADYDAVYVHFGQSVQGQEELDKGYVDELNGLSGIGGQVFYRTNDKKAPHNAYTSTEGLQKGLAAKGFATTYNADEHKHFQFAPAGQTSDLTNGADCAAVSLYFYDNKPYFTYDAANSVYNRFEFGVPQVDAAAGNAQISVSNIILQYVNSSYYEPDQKYRLKLDMVGSGSGKFITRGKMEDITWKKDSDTGITHYYDASGSEITLNPGKTWISIVEANAVNKNAFYATVDEFNNR